MIAYGEDRKGWSQEAWGWSQEALYRHQCCIQKIVPGIAAASLKASFTHYLPVSPLLLKKLGLPRFISSQRSLPLLVCSDPSSVLRREPSHSQLLHPLPQGTAEEGVVEAITSDPAPF